MVNWCIDQEKWIPVLEKWTSMTPEQRADAGEGVKILGRWHDLVSRTGVAILEAAGALFPPQQHLDVGQLAGRPGFSDQWIVAHYDDERGADHLGL
jgi:hypothetical protein